MNTKTLLQEDLKTKFAELSELTSADQQAALVELASTDPALAHELASLLGHANATVPGLSAPERLLHGLSQSSLPEQFGQWRVLGELGRGGMGVVLRGQRADGAFDKQVAIKVLPPLMATAEAGQRFLQEARLLAPLDHPHIARLIDAGMAQGCAYFVMDLVEGLPINHHAGALPLKDRLRLFLQLCAALSFAHGRLLIHRDIKPANVLVDKLGNVRLLDFGIAKLMDEGEATRTAQATAFTPAYASPEQMQGDAIGVASDVFSLGVLLYELCTQVHPFLGDQGTEGSNVGSGAANTLATMAAVLERQPARPPMQQAQLPKDLQAILLKTLEKEPARRYGSVDALASDIEAYLDGLPVKAQTPSWSYQASKFVRRNAGAVSVTAITAAAILGLSAWSLYSAKVAREQSSLAQKRLESVRAIANKVVFDYNKALEPIAGTLAVRKTIVQDALGYLEAQASEAKGDAALQADIASGFEAVGDVQGGGLGTSNLGDLVGAGQSYQRALALRMLDCQTRPNSLVTVNAPQRLPACSALAATHVQLSENQIAQNKVAESVAHLNSARDLNAKALAGADLKPETLAATKALHYKILRILGGMTTRLTGDSYAQGLGIAQENLPIAQAMAAGEASPAAQARLQDATEFLAHRLLGAGQAQAALPHMEAALAIGRKRLAAQPNGANAAMLATSMATLAEIKQHLLMTTEAQALALEATELLAQSFRADPENTMIRTRYINLGRRVGTVFNMAGDKLSHATAARLLAQVAEVSGKLDPSKEPVNHLQHQWILREWAKAALALGDAALATKLLQPFADTGATNPRTALDWAGIYFIKAQIAEQKGDLAAAKSKFALALQPLKAGAQQTPANRLQVAHLAQVCAWAAQAKALADSRAEHAQCASSQKQALADANALTPWWAKQLQ